MTSRDLIAELHAGRQRFLALVAELRPELHRYCARMTGSVADGEDVVQDALARAYYALSELDELPPLRPWLFRIAHNRAIDVRRRYDQRMQVPLEAVESSAHDPGPDPEDTLARDRAVAAAISQFIELAPAQRSCVILKDVLDHSLDDIAALLELSVPAVKAALHRGRARLAALRAAAEPARAAGPPSAQAVRYAQLFNARDWDAVRAMLADDVRLDLVARVRRAGRRDVGSYFTNYDKYDDWYVAPASLEGREVLAVSAGPGQPPRYFVELVWRTGEITELVEIRDFRYVPYIAREAAIELAPA